MLDPNLESDSVSGRGEGLQRTGISEKLEVMLILLIQALRVESPDQQERHWFAHFGDTDGERTGNPLQYSCLENSVDRGAWWAAVHGVAQSWMRLKRLSMHASIGEGTGNPLQCSCLENPRDGGTWWAAVYGVAQSRP